MKKGLDAAGGEILLFLHDDTVLPLDWDRQIALAMQDPKVSGGAFRMRFHPEPGLLKALRKLGNLLTLLTHEFWGDHGIFIRREILLREPEVLDVPIMEDVRLSGLLRRSGKTVLLPCHVQTDPSKFIRNGALRQTAKNFLLRFLYALGAKPEWIFRKYYGKVPGNSPPSRSSTLAGLE